MIEAVPKKTRAFVEETDVFDFTGMNKVLNKTPVIKDTA
jgi:hypothetical protein